MINNKNKLKIELTQNYRYRWKYVTKFQLMEIIIIKKFNLEYLDNLLLHTLNFIII